MNEAKAKAAEEIRAAKQREGLSWAEIAEAIGRPKEWTVSALLGQHPVPEDAAVKVGELLGLSDESVQALQRQPYRTGLGDAANDPTIYRFIEAINVYGPAIKELIHEEFGDGIMSAIDFSMDIQREANPNGDRVNVVLSGKFLPYKQY